MARNSIERAIMGLTAHIIAYRFALENERMAKMDRLSEKVSRASGVVGRLTKKFEVKLDELIARENPVDQRIERTFATAHGAVDDHLRGLDQLESQLALISNAPLDEHSNGGPPGHHGIASANRESV